MTCLGMRLRPNKVEDLILGYISEEYRHHYRLPTNLEEGVNMVMCALKHTAERFINKHGMMPCLFIDGVDLLAAQNKKVLRLVSYAKEFANNRLLHIVMVSSEESVMPILNKTSAMNRLACLIEVGDILYPEAVTFLMSGGIAESTSTKLAQHLGEDLST